VIRLEKADLSQEEYEKLFCEGFGEYKGEMPQHTFLVFDADRRIAFCSVYAHSAGNLYLQHIAYAKDVEVGNKYRHYLEILKALHDLGFPFIMGAISNKNKGALMFALRSGFKINGVRQATTGELFVEVLHYQEVK